MTRRREAYSPYQVRFGADFQIVQPRLVSEIPQGEAILSVLPGMKLWQNRPSGDCLLVDAENHQGSVIDPEAWVLRRDFFGYAPIGTEKFSGSIIVVGPLDQKIKTARDVLVEVVPKLRPSSPVFVFEHRTEDAQKAWRFASMRHGGVVKASVLFYEHDDYIIWRGRTPKEVERHAVDLISVLAKAAEPWKRALIKDKLERMKQAYADLGYIVVSADQIMDQLTHTRYVPRDSASLDFGFGVTVRSSHCDCTWQVDLKGNNRLIRHCDDYDCDGQPPPRLEKRLPRSQSNATVHAETVGHFPQFNLSHIEEYPNKWCKDHNKPYVQQCRIVREHPTNGMIQIEFERYCPECPEIPMLQKVWVYGHQLIR